MKFSEGLKKNEAFRTVYRKGRAFSDDILVLHVRRNGTDRNRIGISASKKTGNSVIRHGFIRRIREIYRLHEEEFLAGYDLVAVARLPVKELSFEADYYRQLERSFLKLAKKAGIII